MDYKTQSQMEQSVAMLRDLIPHYIPVMPHIAKLYKGYFDALVGAGFSETQAIYLIGQHGTSLGIKDGKEDK